MFLRYFFTCFKRCPFIEFTYSVVQISTESILSYCSKTGEKKTYTTREFKNLKFIKFERELTSIDRNNSAKSHENAESIFEVWFEN